MGPFNGCCITYAEGMFYLDILLVWSFFSKGGEGRVRDLRRKILVLNWRRSRCTSRPRLWLGGLGLVRRGRWMTALKGVWGQEWYVFETSCNKVNSSNSVPISSPEGWTCRLFLGSCGGWGSSGVSSVNSFPRPCCYGCLLISKLLSFLEFWPWWLGRTALTPVWCSIMHSISVKDAITDCKQASLLLMSSRGSRASIEAELTCRQHGRIPWHLYHAWIWGLVTELPR